MHPAPAGLHKNADTPLPIVRHAFASIRKMMAIRIGTKPETPMDRAFPNFSNCV